MNNESNGQEEEYDIKTIEKKLNITSKGISNLQINSEPLGEKREDKGVVVKDAGGNEMKTSSIMMGYNKKHLQLENGEYVSEAEAYNALVREITKTGGGKTIICKKTGKAVSAEEMANYVLFFAKTKGFIRLGEKSSKIDNQDSRTIAIGGGNQKHSVAKGVLMLGNNGIKLPCGDYIKLNNIYIAVQDYVTKKGYPTDPEVEEVNKPKPEPKPKETYIVKKIEKISLHLSPILAAALISLVGAVLVAMIKPPHDIKGEDITKAIYELDYESAKKVEKELEETLDQIYRRAYSDINIGNKIIPDKGVVYHESSDYEYGGKNNTGIFGSKIRPVGSYKVEQISILDGNGIRYVTLQEGKNLYDTLESIANKLGVGIADLNASIHLGEPVAGWVSVNELLKDELNPQVISKSVVLEDSQKGVIKDFSGDTITIDTPNGKVSLKITDNNGNILQPGSTVIGSDGNEYQFNGLDLKKDTVIQEGETTHKGWSLGFTVQNYRRAIEFAIAAMTIGTLISLITAKRNEKEFLVGDGKSEEIRNHTGNAIATSGSQNIIDGESKVFVEPILKAGLEDEAIIEEGSKDNLRAVNEAKKDYDKFSNFTKLKNRVFRHNPKWNQILDDLENNRVTQDEVKNMFKK